MLYPRNQNWRTSQKAWTLSLANAVNTGTSYTTSSGTVPNQQYWNSVGFRGLGPTLTFPGGSGMDGIGCGCGCDGGGNSNLLLYLLAGAGAYFLFTGIAGRRSHGD